MQTFGFMQSETAHPFIKWVGGKSQLLEVIRQKYPMILSPAITKYAEPFIGGGAVLLDVLTSWNLDEVYISDSNLELINTYRAVRDDVEGLIEYLRKFQMEFLSLDKAERKLYYYAKRDRFNAIELRDDSGLNLEKAALFIFLNKTCFNGLYRVNSQGQFNVPMGDYKNPCICDPKNLSILSRLLKKVKMHHGDYRESFDFIDEHTFVYFDPPYRPLSATSGFTSYTEGAFNDDSQRELAEYARRLDQKGAKVLLSNSDPKNTDPNDEFFDELYAGFEIQRVEATRMVNCNADARGKIRELLISNF